MPADYEKPEYLSNREKQILRDNLTPALVVKIYKPKPKPKPKAPPKQRGK